jgi:hypothetical protein
MQALLDAGAAVGQAFPWTDGQLTTAALVACALGSVEMLQLLLRFGETVDGEGDGDTVKTDTLVVTAVHAANSKGAVSRFGLTRDVYGKAVTRGVKQYNSHSQLRN